MRVFIQYHETKVPLTIEPFEVRLLSCRELVRRARDCLCESETLADESRLQSHRGALAYRGRLFGEDTLAPLSTIGLRDESVLQYVVGRQRGSEAASSSDDDTLEPALHFGSLAHVGLSTEDVSSARLSFYSSLALGAARGERTGRPLADALAPRLLRDPLLPQALSAALTGDPMPSFITNATIDALPSEAEALAVEDEWFRSEVQGTGGSVAAAGGEQGEDGWRSAVSMEGGLLDSLHPFGATPLLPPPPAAPHIQLLDFTVPLGTPKHAFLGVLLGFFLIPFSFISLCTLPLSRLARVGVILGISLNIFLALMHILST
eukprot:CAMPEP_0170741978 /NCGR_PEP_ID=MMETSP0437-20130122/6503_1 /TAXON_ID=0 /ORGANISM="Sexangularia sp." /LENGTH=319 /DNA_ID=CAMNT_0011080577 /DNA_START=1 /DNA_END=960 /DNA_ORIENTATION=-